VNTESYAKTAFLNKRWNCSLGCIAKIKRVCVSLCHATSCSSGTTRRWAPVISPVISPVIAQAILPFLSALNRYFGGSECLWNIKFPAIKTANLASINQRAFRGELVSQDPNDEPKPEAADSKLESTFGEHDSKHLRS
jgi:hypothetical protein